MNKTIINYISTTLINEPLDTTIEADDDLLGTGLLDSLGMMKLIAFLEEEYKIIVGPEDMIIDNFMTVEHITQYLATK